MGDRKWRSAQEVRRGWPGLHITLFSLLSTRPQATAVLWWGPHWPESADGSFALGTERLKSPYISYASPSSIKTLRWTNEFQPSDHLWVCIQEDCPPILKAQALTLGVGPPVGWSQCDRLLGGLTRYHLQWRPDAFSCFLPTLASLAQGVRGSERGELDCSGDGCLEFGEYRDRAITVMMHKNLCYALSSLSKAYVLGTIHHPNQVVKGLSHSRQARRGPWHLCSRTSICQGSVLTLLSQEFSALGPFVDCQSVFPFKFWKQWTWQPPSHS